jgi:MFS family permease
MTTSKAWALVMMGYSVLAVAMLAFLSANGEPGSAVGTIGTAGLIGLGLVLPVTGMLELTRRIDQGLRRARKGMLLQSFALLGLLIGLLVSFAASSLPGHVISAAFIVVSGSSGLVGAINLSRGFGAAHLAIGAALIAIGAALIPASNIALQQYLISDLQKNVYQDIGATIAACGCVVAAYSCFIVRSRSTVPVATQLHRRGGRLL